MVTALAEPVGEHDRRRAGRLVLGDPGLFDEAAGADRRGVLVDPGPGVGGLGAAGRPAQLPHGGRGLELDVVELRRPLGAGGDVDLLAVEAHADLAGRRLQGGDGAARPRQQPGGADRRVAGEGQLEARGEDPDPAAARVVDEDRLAEAELGGDPLALGLRHLSAVEEDAEGVAPLTFIVDEDAEDVELGHVAILCGSEMIAGVQSEISNEGANVPEGELKRVIARRGKALVVVLAVGAAGVAWAGCGSDSNSDESSSKLEQNITEGINEAQDAVEKGVNEAKESLKGTSKKTKKQLEKAEEEVKKGLEKGQKEVEKGLEGGKAQAQKGVEEAEKYAP